MKAGPLAAGKAWPFLIGRSRSQDHRIVVLPEFMKSALLSASALSSETGGDLAKPGVAFLRELPVPDGPVTAVYRVFEAQPEDYLLPGDGLLTDDHGRPIVLTEGLVLRCTAAAVRQAGISQADLGQAHALVVPAYQDFWAQDGRFCRQAAASFALAARERCGPLLILDAGAAPVPESGLADSQDLARNEDRAADSTGTAPRDQVRRSSRASVAAKVSGILIAAVLVAAGVRVMFRALSITSAPPGQTLSELCDAARSGHLDTVGYALGASSYRRETSRLGFAGELLQGSSRVTLRCSYQITAILARTMAQALMMVGRPDQPVIIRLITLTRQHAGNWQIAGVSPIAGQEADSTGQNGTALLDELAAGQSG